MLETARAMIGFLQQASDKGVTVGQILVYVFGALGGAAGLGSLIKYRHDTRHLERADDADDRRVGIAEFEAAMKGMGQVVEALRLENVQLSDRIGTCESDRRVLHDQIDTLNVRIRQLETGGSR